MIITEKIINILTGEETVVEREETTQEKEERLFWENKKNERAAKEAELMASRKTIFDKLGLTEEEAALLLGAN